MSSGRESAETATGSAFGALESKEPERRSFGDYKKFIQNHYDGLPGALTAFTGLVTGHEALAGRLIRPGQFDVAGCKAILDAGCGNGRYSWFLLKHADPDARLTAFDLSQQMLRRAHDRLKNDRVTHAAADLTRLPYADAAFDAVVCGWVLEHLPDPRPGLHELARVMRPGARLLLLCTEDTLTGALCSRMWHCRTYDRTGLRQVCADCGLAFVRDHWFSRVHRWMHLGGIIMELQRA
jgi:SAM-dependent methyltransferase